MFLSGYHRTHCGQLERSSPVEKETTAELQTLAFSSFCLPFLRSKERDEERVFCVSFLMTERKKERVHAISTCIFMDNIFPPMSIALVDVLPSLLGCCVYSATLSALLSFFFSCRWQYDSEGDSRKITNIARTFPRCDLPVMSCGFISLGQDLGKPNSVVCLCFFFPASSFLLQLFRSSPSWLSSPLCRCFREFTSSRCGVRRRRCSVSFSSSCF